MQLFLKRSFFEIAGWLDIIAEPAHIGKALERSGAPPGMPYAQGSTMEVEGGYAMSDGKNGLQLRSLLKKSGELEISLVNVPTPEPGPDEVVVRVGGAPINPSDLGLLIGPADMSTAKVSGSRELPVITARLHG